MIDSGVLCTILLWATSNSLTHTTHLLRFPSQDTAAQYMKQLACEEETPSSPPMSLLTSATETSPAKQEHSMFEAEQRAYLVAVQQVVCAKDAHLKQVAQSCGLRLDQALVQVSRSLKTLHSALVLTPNVLLHNSQGAWPGCQHKPACAHTACGSGPSSAVRSPGEVAQVLAQLNQQLATISQPHRPAPRPAPPGDLAANAMDTE